MEILLASSSELKRSAVLAAYPGSVVHTFSGARGASFAQPIGYLDTVRGARRRLSDTLNVLEFDELGPHNSTYKYLGQPRPDLVIAIESGLIEVDNYWVDVAVVIQTKHRRPPELGYTKYNIIESTGVIVPIEYVRGVLSGRYSTWSEGDPRMDRKDPHKFLCGTSRKEFLTLALRNAQGDFPFCTKENEADLLKRRKALRQKLRLVFEN